MQNCNVALNYRQQQCGLNAPRNLESVVCYISIDLQELLAGDKVGRENREAGSEAPTGFIEAHRRVVSSRFGQIMGITNRVDGANSVAQAGESNDQVRR